MRILLILVLMSVLRLAMRTLLPMLQRKVQEYKDIHDTTYTPEVSTIPDMPQPFGYKTGWLAIRDAEPMMVIRALGLKDRAKANWESGLTFAGSRDQVFVTPKVGDFVLVVGILDLFSNERKMDGLARHFREMQYFVTHRVTEYHGWAKYRDGRLIRRYCYLGETGQVLHNYGGLTLDELRLGFDRFPTSDDCDWDNIIIPNEEDVLSIAAKWGVDTTFQKYTGGPGIGYLCTLPN